MSPQNPPVPELDPQHVPFPRWIIYWDPPPPWVELNKDLLRRFTQMEIQFKAKELQLQLEKLEQLGKMIM